MDTQIHTLSIGLSEAGHWPLHGESLAKKPCWGRTERQILAWLRETTLEDDLDLCGDCRGCLPCPQGIDIPEVLRLYHLDRTLKMGLYGHYRYDLMTPGSHWMPGSKGNRCDRCGLCLPRCPQQLSIADLVHQAHRAFTPSCP